MRALNSMTVEELENFFEERGEPKFRGSQLFEFFHSQLGRELSDCSTLSKDLRRELKDYPITRPELFRVFESQRDETKKFLFKLEDEELIEGVLMTYKHGLSQCISTQVGCKMGCSFCASTKDGWIRNLTAGEMAEQVYLAERKYGRVSNIILMGSGEPFDNMEEVFRFLEILHHPKGQNMSYRNMTISTCGVIPGIRVLADKNIPVTLAISLHSPFQGEREKMMPVTKKYPVRELMKASKDYFEKTGRRVTYEYTLIDGVNNRKQDALELKRLLGDIPHHINLIPLNPIREYDKKKPEAGEILKFQRELKSLGLSVTIRRELGGDINASCGQLRRSWQSKEKV